MSSAYEVSDRRNGDHEECRDKKTGFMQPCSSYQQNMKQPGNKNADGSTWESEPHMANIYISDQKYGGNQQHGDERGGGQCCAE